MAGRGRPKLSEEQKAKNKAAKEAKLNDPRDAVLAFPKDDEKLTEDLVTIPKDLKAEAREAASALSDHKKTVRQQLRLDPIAAGFVEKLLPLAENRRSRVLRQVEHLAGRLNLDPQPDLPLAEPGSSDHEAAGPIFDATSAGQRQSDIQPKAAKTKEPPPAPVDTGKLEPDEAVKAFEGAKEAAEKKRAGRKGKAPPPAPVGVADEDDVRPRHLRQADQDREDRDGEGPVRSPVPDDEPVGSFRVLN